MGLGLGVHLTLVNALVTSEYDDEGDGDLAVEMIEVLGMVMDEDHIPTLRSEIDRDGKFSSCLATHDLCVSGCPYSVTEAAGRILRWMTVTSA
jgi:hypothetical protein